MTIKPPILEPEEEPPARAIDWSLLKQEAPTEAVPSVQEEPLQQIDWSRLHPPSESRWTEEPEEQRASIAWGRFEPSEEQG
jgi:hypothetical protein